MKRKLLAMLAVATTMCLAFGIAACGEQGEKGEAGANGKSAYEIWIENGHTGSEEDFLEWLKGENGQGRSAYEIWLENGHEGSEEDFLEWLKGEKGDRGEICEHNYSAWKTQEEATCTSIGYRSRTCSVCGDVDYMFLSALGHTKGEFAYADGVLPKKLHQYLCKTCGQVISEAHSFDENGDCACCIHKDDTFGLAFQLNNSGISYTLTGLGSVGALDIRIPAYYHGLPVTAIGEAAFRVRSYGSDITSVIIPDTVKTIGESAFAECNKLKSVTMGIGVTFIDEYAFECDSLETIYYSGTMAQWNQIKKDKDWIWVYDGELTVVCKDGNITVDC